MRETVQEFTGQNLTHQQGHHGRFLAGKTSTGHITHVLPLPPLNSFWDLILLVLLVLPLVAALQKPPE